MSKIAIADKTDYPDLDKAHRRHVSVLKERRRYLHRRIEEVPSRAASYHRSEVEALDWALDLIDERFAS